MNDSENNMKNKPQAPSSDAAMRLHNRFRTNQKATVSCPSWKSVEQFVISNISRGGMFIIADRPAPVGSEVAVEVTLPNGYQLQLHGTVRHVTDTNEAVTLGRHPGMGVEVDLEYLDQLEQLLRFSRQQILHGDDVEQGSPLLQADTILPQGMSASEQSSASANTGPLPSTNEAIVAVSDVEQKETQAVSIDDFCDIVGIDFGVCYSSVAVGSADTVFLVPDELGERSIASVVYYGESGDPVVGNSARGKLASEPHNVVPSIKRLMGRNHSDPLVSGLLHSAPYKTSAGPNDSILIDVGSHSMPVSQVSADILRHLVKMTRLRLRRDHMRAVLTHPVAWDKNQIIALRTAAKLAQIDVVDLIPEPVAVAMAYGLGHERNEIVAIYDFGGGTFDFSIVDLSHDQHRVLVTEGDSWLGGDDFDIAIADAIANALWKQTGVEMRTRAVEWQLLLMACEETKRRLSFSDEAEIRLPGMKTAEGELKHGRMKMNRVALQRICQQFFDRSIEICERAMNTIGLEARDMTSIVLSGGTSRIPFVHKGLEQFFERDIDIGINPQDAVVLGAGLHAARLSGYGASKVQIRQ